MSSMLHSKASAIWKASGREGSYFPFSIERTVCRETPRVVARCCCDQPISSRRCLNEFSNSASPLVEQIAEPEVDHQEHSQSHEHPGQLRIEGKEREESCSQAAGDQSIVEDPLS